MSDRVIRRSLTLITLFVLAGRSPALSNINVLHAHSKALQNREVHDEPDPDAWRDCREFGGLKLIFGTETRGLPNVAVVLTDPRGRRIGFDPFQNRSWDELPVAQGFIACDNSYVGGSCRGVVQVCGP